MKSIEVKDFYQILGGIVDALDLSWNDEAVKQAVREAEAHAQETFSHEQVNACLEHEIESWNDVLNNSIPENEKEIHRNSIETRIHELYRLIGTSWLSDFWADKMSKALAKLRRSA